MLEEIRQGCRRVAQQAQQVRIVEERLAAYAGELARHPLQHLQLDANSHFLGPDEEETVAFFLTLDTINFGSGYFPALGIRPEQSGYYTLAGALTDWFNRQGMLGAAELASISPQRCAEIFRQDLTRPAAADLMQLFARAWRELGSFLLAHHGGRFSALVERAGGCAEKLVGLLGGLPSYRDRAVYRGEEVLFYKRAQIAVADLYLAFGGEGAGEFRDIDRLTLFADNLVPHVLRQDGVLVYGAELAQRIGAGEPLPAGSAEEVEIRGCAVEAVERLVADLQQRGTPVFPLHLDNFLWHRGQQPDYRRTPRHRTLTCFY
ncbi:MAG: hypothetical protein IH614_11330 [Desulfuromonadales bacterium]|nr:hypothetical protein [Desulfuromonadales bacterium]